MKQLFNSKQIKSLMPYFWLALAIILAYKLVNELGTFFSFIGWVWGIITPFLYGFLLAYILSIPCDGMQKLLLKTKSKFISKRKKALSILFVYLIFLLILFLIFNTVAPYISASVAHFTLHWESYYESIKLSIAQIGAMTGVYINVEVIEDHIATFFTTEMESISENISSYIQSSLSAIFGVGAALFRGFIAFIASIYILFEKETFKRYLCRLLWVFVPEAGYNLTLKYSRKLNYNFKQYIYTQTLDGIILGTIVGIELWIMGSPYALTLAIVLGLVNYIPYFGSIFGTLVAAIIVALTQGLTMGAIALIVLFITQQIDGNIIQPKLMGGSFSISPFLVIISVTVGGALGGVLGMIAAIPIVAMFKDLIEDIVSYYERVKTPDPEPAEGE